MISDILLSCLSMSRQGQSIKSFLTSNVVEQFIHPCERSMFIEILGILNYVNEIDSFAKHFESVQPNEADDLIIANEYSSGYYLRHFAKAIDSVLEEYYVEIACLEDFHENASVNSLIHIYNALQLQLPTILVIRKLINNIRIQKLHGCGLLQYLHKQYGDVRNDPIISKLSKPVKLAFFFHLSHWLLFGTIDDPHSEFFISFKKSTESDKSTSSSNINLSILSDEDDIWQYEIKFSQLPSFVSSVLAEKILFIGQTVLIYKLDRSRRKVDAQNIFYAFYDDVSELWAGKESNFFKLIENLNNDDMIDIFKMDGLINEIKIYVSQRLWQISNVEDDISKQIKLVKDFYLLGRGEFYLEFLRHLYGSSDDLLLDTNEKNYTRAFEFASNVMGISNELENFSLTILKSKTDLEESCEFGMLQNLHLKYVCKWPLSMLFSPMSIERYNHVFRFLLTVRKLQYDLQLVWTRHKWSARTSPVHLNILNFRNHLTFFFDNLQYYIQVDVLESQFSILMAVIKAKDFEEIQRAHSVFLANVLSQCFLLSDTVDKKLDISQINCKSQYSIFGTILEIFSICEKFCLLDSIQSTGLEEFKILEERFNVSILNLIQLLGTIKNASSFGSLSQFLLRLDYNRWFSGKKLSLESS